VKINPSLIFLFQILRDNAFIIANFVCFVKLARCKKNMKKPLKSSPNEEASAFAIPKNTRKKTGPG